MSNGTTKSSNRFLSFIGILLLLLIYCAGFALDCWTLLPFFENTERLLPPFHTLLLYHILASTVMAWALYRLLPLKYRSEPLRAFLYYLTLGFFIPLVGNLGLLLVFLLGVSREKRLDGDDHVWRVTGQALMPNRAPDLHERPKFGANGMQSRLRRSKDSSEHLGIVLATRFMGDENAVPLLNTALKNPEDDVRLLAFSLLEKKNADINARIEKLQKGLVHEEEKIKAHLTIARNYLRLVTLGLIQDEMKAQALQKAQENVKRALEENPEERTGHFILGQVLLEQGHVNEAEDAFTKALAFGFSPTAVYPFLAQAAFLKKQFERIPNYLENIPAERRLYPPLANVANYWL